MKLEIHPVGNPEFPRFVIANDRGEVFDGDGWNRDQNRAMLQEQFRRVTPEFTGR